MNPEIKIHLNVDEILIAGTDINDLADEQKKHLSECSECRNKLKNFNSELRQIGHLARKFSPEPRRKIILKNINKEKPYRRLKWAIPTAAVSAVLSIFLFIFLLQTPIPTIQEDPDDILAFDFFEEDIFMSEINSLAEHTLSPVYMYISGENEYLNGFDNEYENEEEENDIESLFNSFTIQKTIKKGVSKC